MDIAGDRKHAGKDRGDGEIGLLRGAAGQRVAEQGPAHHVEPVRTADGRGLHGDTVEDHGQSQGEHSEEHARIPREQWAHQHAHRASREGGEDDDPDHVGQAEQPRCHRGDVAADGVIEALAERDEPRAHEQHNAEREDAARQRRRGQRNQPGRQDEQRREQPDRSGGCYDDRADHQIFLTAAAWNSPSGRNRRTHVMAR